MAFGVYKPGQGYWVRVMTAVMAGMLVLAGCGWLWQQLGAVHLPYGSWRIGVSGLPAESVPAPGTRVDLLPERSAPPLGSAEVAAFEPTGGAGGVLTVRDFKSGRPKDDPSMAHWVGIGPGVVVPYAGQPQGVPVIERIYLQAGGVVVVMIVGAGLIYWIVAVRPKSAEFLIATDGEMRKVNWSTWRDIRGSTMVVIFASFLIAAGLFCVDFVFSQFFRLIGVLEQ